MTKKRVLYIDDNGAARAALIIMGRWFKDVEFHLVQTPDEALHLMTESEVPYNALIIDNDLGAGKMRGPVLYERFRTLMADKIESAKEETELELAKRRLAAPATFYSGDELMDLGPTAIQMVEAGYVRFAKKNSVQDLNRLKAWIAESLGITTPAAADAATREAKTA